ncbi:MAG TPA: hypothetical protein VFY39_13365, partial [Gammaproteobacteria bacterium]|nr:hypothetical protein [Gammaproteobacteria bacterium]
MTRTKSPARGLFVLSAMLLASCSGSGEGTTPPGGTQSGGGTAPPPTGGGTALQANFKSIQDNVFTPICTACHAGASAPRGLRLDDANAYALLVGVASSEQPQLLRVDPGNPDQSYLIQKLEGSAAVGGQMPLNGTRLPQADIDVIRQWILDGAQPTAPAAPPAAPIRVTSLSPLPDSTLEQLPTSIMVVFDREVDASSVTASTFMLERSGGDGSFSEGNEVVVTAPVSVPAANPSTAVMDLSMVQSVPDTYRVILVGTGAATILDLDAQALDGEYAASFPSGDGSAGGNFAADFTVGGIQPTLDSIQTNVFTPICSACHTGGGSQLPGSMDLTNADASMLSLVGVASVEQPQVMRV